MLQPCRAAQFTGPGGFTAGRQPAFDITRLHRLPLQGGIGLALAVLAISGNPHTTHLHAAAKCAAFAQHALGVYPLGGLNLGGAFQRSLHQTLPDGGEFVLWRQGSTRVCQRAAAGTQARQADSPDMSGQAAQLFHGLHPSHPAHLILATSWPKYSARRSCTTARSSERVVS